MYECPQCKSEVLAERWEAGYQYCKAKRCFEVLGRKAHVKVYQTAPEELDITVYDIDGLFPEDDIED